MQSLLETVHFFLRTKIFLGDSAFFLGAIHSLLETNDFSDFGSLHFFFDTMQCNDLIFVRQCYASLFGSIYFFFKTHFPFLDIAFPFSKVSKMSDSTVCIVQQPILETPLL